MSVTVQLPLPMRQAADGQERIQLEADTVGQAVDALCSRYGQLRNRLYKPTGRLKGSITIFVNNAQPAAKADTKLQDGDTLVILQPVGGG